MEPDEIRLVEKNNPSWPGIKIEANMMRLPNQIPKITEEAEYEYFRYFIQEEDTFCSDNAIFAGINLKNAASDLGEILAIRPHDIDGIRGKASEVLCALSIFCSNNRSLKAFQKSMEIQPTNRTLIQHAYEINKLCSSIVELDLPTCLYNFVDQALPEMQKQIYQLSDELLGISGLRDIHELMSLAIEVHCNEDLLMQRLQHIKKHSEQRRTYEKRTIYPWKYYWNPHNPELLEFIAGCSEITLGKPYTLKEMIDIILCLIRHKINDHKESEEELTYRISQILNIPKEKIDFNQRQTLIYPLQKSIYPVTFEEAWRDKFKNEVVTPQETYCSIYQPDWNIPLWCKPSIGPVPLGYCNRKGTLNYVISHGPAM